MMRRGLRIRKITTVHPNTKIINGNGFYGRVQDTPLTGDQFYGKRLKSPLYAPRKCMEDPGNTLQGHQAGGLG